MADFVHFTLVDFNHWILGEHKMDLKHFALFLVFIWLSQASKDKLNVEGMPDETRMWLCRHMGPLEISTTQLMENPEDMEGIEDLVKFIFKK